MQRVQIPAAPAAKPAASPMPPDPEPSHAVALQVEFERQTLKPVFHLIGYRLWV
jgi:hypothetical protein